MTYDARATLCWQCTCITPLVSGPTAAQMRLVPLASIPLGQAPCLCCTAHKGARCTCLMCAAQHHTFREAKCLAEMMAWTTHQIALQTAQYAVQLQAVRASTRQLCRHWRATRTRSAVWQLTPLAAGLSLAMTLARCGALQSDLVRGISIAFVLHRQYQASATSLDKAVSPEVKMYAMTPAGHWHECRRKCTI